MNKDRPPPFFNTIAIATVMLEVRTLERDISHIYISYMMMGLSSYSNIDIDWFRAVP